MVYSARAFLTTGLLGLVLLLNTQAFALPMPDGRNATPPPNGRDYDFEGIVELSNCSGSFVRFENSLESDMAMVLTNGHCYEQGFLDPGEVLYGVGSTRRFRLLNSKGQEAGVVQATQVLYATMTKTDMNLYRLNETYAQILSRLNIRPLTMASTAPALETPVEVISGYWHWGYRCNLEFQTFELHEGGWVWSESLRYSRPGCEVIGGTSGSPVIHRDTREVIAINNTGNESGGRCGQNNPCEVDQNGNISYQQGYTYSQQTYWVYSCLNVNREIDLSVPGCQLPKPQ